MNIKHYYHGVLKQLSQIKTPDFRLLNSSVPSQAPSCENKRSICSHLFLVNFASSGGFQLSSRSWFKKVVDVFSTCDSDVVEIPVALKKIKNKTSVRIRL